VVRATIILSSDHTRPCWVDGVDELWDNTTIPRYLYSTIPYRAIMVYTGEGDGIGWGFIGQSGSWITEDGGRGEYN
jgi:hypothetical protein